MRRIIVPNLPHHIVQRGLNGRQTFLIDDDYEVYLKIMAQCCRQYQVEILAYSLMPDHVHLIAIPKDYNALSSCLRVAHGRYSKYINRRTGRTGACWQGRYSSHLLDQHYLLTCARYIEINAVKREYVDRPEQWRWSSAQAHIDGCDDDLVRVQPLLDRVNCAKMSWQEFLAVPRPDSEADMFYAHEKSGLPLGDEAFKEMVAKVNNHCS